MTGPLRASRFNDSTSTRSSRPPPTRSVHPDPALERPSTTSSPTSPGPGARRLSLHDADDRSGGSRRRAWARALVEPARQPRTLQRRPYVRGGRRPLPGHRQADLARHRREERRPLAPTFGTGPARARLPATRKSRSAWPSSTASPATDLPRPGEVLPRRARPRLRRREARGRPFAVYDSDEYMQDHKPVLEQDEAVGHAVRAMYMYSAMTDVAALGGPGLRHGHRPALGERRPEERST